MISYIIEGNSINNDVVKNYLFQFLELYTDFIYFCYLIVSELSDSLSQYIWVFVYYIFIYNGSMYE